MYKEGCTKGTRTPEDEETQSAVARGLRVGWGGGGVMGSCAERMYRIRVS